MIALQQHGIVRNVALHRRLSASTNMFPPPSFKKVGPQRSPRSWILSGVLTCRGGFLQCRTKVYRFGEKKYPTVPSRKQALSPSEDVCDCRHCEDPWYFLGVFIC